MQETHSSYLFLVSYKKKFAVLKIYKAHSDEALSSQALSFFNGIGSVHVLKSNDKAILLEKVTPGHDLTKIINPSVQTKIFCEVIKKLHSKKLINKNLTLPSICSLESVFKKPPPKELSRNTLNSAKKVFEDIFKKQKRQIVLHGDLHHYNILKRKDSAWVAIDPKGYIGEPEYDIGAFLRNPVENHDLFLSRTAIEERLKLFENILGYDSRKIIKWAYVQVICCLMYDCDTSKKYFSEWNKFSRILSDLLKPEYSWWR